MAAGQGIMANTGRGLTVLIIGSGGREHALLRAIQQSPLAGEVIVAPGNGGMAADARCVPLNVEDVAATVDLARQLRADLVVIGPEVPLALGAADALRAAGIATFGPDAAGAALEASKATCKAFLQRWGIPTAAYQQFNGLPAALAYLDRCAFPLVIKASGLAAGKGVVICEERAQAEQALRGMLSGDWFGDSGRLVVIEEFLTGDEASLMVLIAGDQYVCLPPSQDHKRVGEGDTGPNTGGMGAYAPARVADEAVMQQVRERIIEPTMRGFAAEGIDFRGVLFVGLMIENGQPKVLEYNVRFGDPECQVLLPLIASDPLELLLDVAHGRLRPERVSFRDAFSLIVVLAARGYPGSYPQGDLIQLPTDLPPGTHILHAGTRLGPNGALLSAGGRVLGVVSQASTLEAAAAAAYAVCDQVQWSNKYFRRDIGHRQMSR